MMKKMFFIFLIFLFFLTSVNALVVEDISQQIQQGNTALIENNAKIEGSVSEMKTQIVELQKTIDLLNKNALMKNDMGMIKQSVDKSMVVWQQQLTILFIVFVVLSFCLLFYAKSKKVI